MNHMTQHAGQKVMPKPEETDDPNDNVFRMPPANHHSFHVRHDSSPFSLREASRADCDLNDTISPLSEKLVRVGNSVERKRVRQ
jgi:hypothetical protein